MFHRRSMTAITLLCLFPLDAGAATADEFEARYRNFSSFSSLGARQDVEDVPDSGPGDMRWVKKWAAVGDSYAAGIGAGERIDWWCSRYDQSYPSLINADLRLSGEQKFEYLACSGAESPVVVDQTNRLSQDQDFITVSSGGNDVGLSDLLNECVYTWSPKVGCEETIGETKRKIEQVLPGNLDTLYAAVSRKLAAGHGTAYITAYARFFEETTKDCDKVSWHWWLVIPRGLPWHWQYLTQQRRRDLNELTDMVNQKVREAAQRAGDNFVVVEYDGYFGELDGRYCMPGVPEPAPNRRDLLFYLDGTDEFGEHGSPNPLIPEVRPIPVPVPPGGQEDQDSVPETSFEGQVLRMMIEGRDRLIDEFDADPAAPEFGRVFLKDSWARVFHPMVKGQAVIANKVLYHMTVRQEVQLGRPPPPEVFELSNVCHAPWREIPDDIAISIGADLNTNFPRYWIMTDGAKFNAGGLYARLRDQACQNICDAARIDGVPGEVVRATRFGEKGCEYSIKIGRGKELYLHVTHDGANCYKSVLKMIETYASTKDAAWIWGPNLEELYQIGIRVINTPGPYGITHDPFPNTVEPLPYMHLACKRTDRGGWPGPYRFLLKLSNWNDGNWGKSIMAEEDRCGSFGSWKFEDEKEGSGGSEPFIFEDGSKSHNWASWGLGWYIAKRCGEGAIERVFGLQRDSVQCPIGRFHEVDMFT